MIEGAPTVDFELFGKWITTYKICIGLVPGIPEEVRFYLLSAPTARYDFQRSTALCRQRLTACSSSAVVRLPSAGSRFISSLVTSSVRRVFVAQSPHAQLINSHSSAWWLLG